MIILMLYLKFFFKNGEWEVQPPMDLFSDCSSPLTQIVLSHDPNRNTVEFTRLESSKTNYKNLK